MGFSFLNVIKDVGHDAGAVLHGNSNPGGGAFGFLRNQLLPPDQQIHANVQKEATGLRQLGQGIAQGGPQIVASVAQAAGHPLDTAPKTSPVGKFLFGDQQLPTIQGGYAQNRQAGHGAPFSFLAAGLSTLGDVPFIPGGKAAGEVGDLIKTSTAADAAKALVKTGVDENIAKSIAPAIAQTKDPNIIQNIITKAHTPPPSPADIVAARTPVGGDLNTVGQGTSEAANQIMSTLAEAQKTRDLQEAGYSAERSARLGQSTAAGADLPGLAGHQAELSALKGELGKQDYQGLAGHLSRPEQDDLFTQLRQEIKSNPDIQGYGKLNASEAVRKVIYGDAGVPTNSEIGLLQKAFGDNFANSVKEDVAAHNERLSAYQNFGQKAAQVAGLPRELMATADFSAGLRQGLAAATRHPTVFAKEFGNQFKYFASGEAYDKADKAIYSHPDYPLLQQAKVNILDVGGKVDNREEKFVSNLGEHIPGVGHLLHASNRAYTGLLNNMRANIFYDKIATLRKAGYDFNDTSNHKLLTDLGKVINTSTGRGDLGRFENAGHALSTALFAPRLIASRLSMLDPRYYINLEPAARKEALTTLMSLGAFGVGVLSLAELAGGKVVKDPTNADFGKVRIGDTRLDPLGGFAQYIRLGAELATGKKTNSTTGATTELGKGLAASRWDVFSNFLTNKEAPLPSFATEVLKGKDAAGNPIDYKKEVASRFIPLLAQDINDLRTHPNAVGGGNIGKVGAAAAGTFGVGLQTYSAQDNPLSTKQKTYIDTLKQNNADPATIKASTAFFQDLKEASGTRTNVNAAVDKALATNDLPKAQRLADQYNKELLAGISGWNKQYGKYANSDLQQAFDKQKINLTGTSVNSRLKAIRSTKPF